MKQKEWLSKLTPLTQQYQWEGFLMMLDYHINNHQRKLEQSVELSEVYRAQGAIAALRVLKTLRDEINAQRSN